MFKMFSYLILPAELALLSGALAPAQSARIEPRSLSFRDAYDLHREADVLRGGGPEYAVVFDRRGLEFTPALGSRAPRNHPFRFTLESICALLEAHRFVVREVTGAVLVCGPFSNLAFTGLTRVMRLNAALGTRFPRAAAAFYLYATTPATSGEDDR